jgi:hypothetical protein
VPTINRKDTTVRVLENVQVFTSRLVTLSGLGLLLNDVDDGHTPLEWKPEHYYFWVLKRVEESD